MKMLSRILFSCLGLLMLASMVPISLQAQESTSPEEQLAKRYSPSGYLRYQPKDCGKPPYQGEPYLPLPVDKLLNNDQVLVRSRSDDDKVMASNFTAQELATFGLDTYLDFPGDPLRPGFTYETDERRLIKDLDLVPTSYARVFLDEENGRLALQYWFYWYFNDWNNTHESDWEGIQLLWDDVSSVEQALAMSPSRIGYSQHGNGEVADWGDKKVELKDVTHPIVYPAAGSHATFFSNDTFLAWGERSSGFGCDVSSPPSVRTPMETILIPNEIDPEGDFAWVLYEGRWGERQPSAFNGPLGPMFNDRWDEPFDVFETWRPFSFVVPNSTALGPTMSEAFCNLTASGSRLM